MENIYNTYDFESHPVIQILQLKLESDESKFSYLNQNLFRNKEQQSQDDLIKIYNDMSIKVPLKEILERTKIEQFFDVNLLNKIASQQEESLENEYYILHFALAFCANVEENFNDDDFQALLKALNTIKTEKNVNIAGNMISYAIFTVSSVIEKVDIKSLLSQIRIYDNTIGYLKKEICASLIFIVFAISSNGRIDEKTEQIFQFLRVEETLSHKVITDLSAAFLFDRCFEELMALNINCLKFLQSFADKLPWCVAERFFTNVGLYFAYFIHQSDKNYLRKIIKPTSKKLLYTSGVSAATYTSADFIDDTKLVANKEKLSCEKLPAVSESFENIKALDLNEEKIEELLSLHSSNPAVIKNLNINLESIEEPDKLDIATIVPTFIQKFHNTSPFDAEQKLVTKYERDELFNVAKDFDEVEKRVSLIIELAEHFPKAKKEIYDSFLSILGNKFDYDISYAFMLFLDQFEDVYDLNSISFIVTRIFDPRVSIFNSNTEQLPFFQMRICTLKVLLKFKEFSINTFAKQFIQYTELSAELFYLIKLFLEKGKIDKRYGHDLCHLLVSFIPVYLNLFFNGNSSIASPIQHIYDALVTVLSDDFFPTKFVDDECFIATVMTLVFDERVRDKTLELVAPILEKTNITKLIQPVELTFAAFDSASEGNKENLLNMLSKILLALSVAIGDKIPPEGSLTQLKENICYVLSNIKQTEAHKSFILSAIHFFSAIENSECLNESERNELIKFLLEFKKNTNEDELYYATRSLIIGPTAKEDASQTYITEPKYLILFFTIFGSRALKFLEQLIGYSQFNRLQCYRGQLDIMLLNKWQNEENEIQQDEIDIFIQIEEVSSSIQVVHKLISMLSCDSEHKLSPHYRKYIQIIKLILATKSRNPICSFPLCNDKNYIEIDGLKQAQSKEPISFMGWVNIDNGEHDSNLMRAVCGDLTLDIKIVCKQIVFILKNASDNTEETFSATLNVQANCWELLAIQFNKAEIEVYFSDQEIKFDHGFDINECDECYIGQEGELVPIPAYLGPFSFVSGLTKEQIKMQDEIGPHTHTFPNSLVSVGMEICNNLLLLETEKENAIKVTLQGTEIPAFFNFSDVLIRFFTAQVLVPIFAQLSLYEGEPTVIDDAIEMLATLFSVSRRSEAVFDEERCWPLVAFLLQKCNMQLTYKNYLQFYSIYTQSSNESFKNEIIRSILMNPLIWRKSTPETTEKVSLHWYETLVPSSNLKQFLHFFGVFFGVLWTKECNQCMRDNAVKTLIEIAENEFTVNNFIILMNFIMKSEDKSVIVASLKIIQGLCLSPKKPLYNVEEQWPLLGKIFLLFEKNIDDVSLEIIRTINILSEGDVILARQYTTYCEIANIFIGGKPHSKEFIIELTKMSEEKPELLTLVSAILAQNTDLLQTFIDLDLKPDSKYTIIKTWDVWLIIAAIESRNEEQIKSIFNFIVNCTNDYWSISFMTIMILTNTEDYTRLFLREAVTKVRNNVNHFSVSQITDLINSCAFFLFYRQTPYENKYLYALMGFGYFKRREEPLTIIERIEKAKTEREFVYGLNFDPITGEWMDTDIAMMLLEIISRLPIQDFNDLGAILAAFLLTQRQQETKKIIPIFLSQHKPSSPVLQLLTSHTKGIGSTLVISPHRDATALDAIPNMLEAFTAVRKSYTMEMMRIADCTARFRERGMKKITKYSKVTLINFPIDLYSCESSVNILKANTKSHWRKFWSRLTSKCAPWHNPTIETAENQYKRDITLCANFTPMKLRVNYDFDDHKDAVMREIVDEDEESSSRFVINDHLFFSEADLSEASAEEDDNYMEEVIFEDDAEIMKLTRSKLIKFTISRNMITLMYGDSNKVIKAKNVTYAFLRSIKNIPNGIEIYTQLGESYLIKLLTKKPKDALAAMSKSKDFSNCVIQTTPPPKFVQQFPETKQWSNGSISNFSYLMFLNVVSGRTYNDSSMYPIFPWVLSDYSTDDIKETPLRDMTKPSGALNEERLSKLKKLRGSNFLYQTTYSTSKNICKYNMRMEPFTTLHIHLNEGKFGNSDSLFYSVPLEFARATTIMSQYNELTPEFFFNNHIFTNENKFDLGEVEETPINDVALPPWAEGDPLKFVYLHRKALESVPNLEKFIDLIWGVSSRGEKALSCDNTFDPKAYPEYWENENFKDEEVIEEAENSAVECGQIPAMLFTTEHPSKKIEETKPIEEKIIRSELGTVLAANVNFNDETITILSGTGLISVVSFNGDHTDITNIDQTIIPRKKGACSALMPDNKILYTTTLGLLLLVDLQKKTVSKIAGHLGVVNCVAASDTLVVSGGSDTTTHIRTQSFEQLFTFASYKEEITCVAASTQFKTIASCTHSGLLYLVDTRRSMIAHEILIDDCFPKDILITPGWGFIVVYYSKMCNGEQNNYLAVYTINGEKRTEFKLGFSVSVMTAWESHDGFDYCILASDKGQLYSFEVFFASPETVLPFAHCCSPVESVSYSEEKKAVVAVTTTGLIHFFPSSALKI